MIISNETKKIIKINFINIFIIAICFIASFMGEFKYILYIAILSAYFFYLINKDENTIILYQFYLLILNEFILDNIFHYMRVQTPLELKYIVEFISIILIIKILLNKNKYKNLIKDKVVITIFVIIIISTAIVIINNESILQLLNSMRIYFRFLPVYLIIINNYIDFKTSYKLLYFASLIMFFLQVILNFHRDFRTGIFGIIGASVFSIFMSIKVLDLSIKFINKKTSGVKLVFFTILTILIFALAESKAFIVILGITMVLILIISKGSILKRSIIISLTICLILLGANIMVKIYPHFSYLLSIENLKYNIDDYIFGNSNKVRFSMGRFEAITYIGNIEQNSINKKVLGLGAGATMPPENLFYINDSKDQQVIDFPKSRIYGTYDTKYGYYLSSLSTIYLDHGYLGVIIIILLLIIILLKSITLIRYGSNINSKSLGAISFFLVIASIFCCLYGADLFYRNYNYMLCIIWGLVARSNKENSIKNV